MIEIRVSPNILQSVDLSVCVSELDAGFPHYVDYPADMPMEGEMGMSDVEYQTGGMNYDMRQHGYAERY